MAGVHLKRRLSRACTALPEDPADFQYLIRAAHNHLQPQEGPLMHTHNTHMNFKKSTGSRDVAQQLSVHTVLAENKPESSSQHSNLMTPALGHPRAVACPHIHTATGTGGVARW